MKNKKFNKTLFYDDACPLCTWYTGAFVKTGLLPPEGRKTFSGISPELLQRINYARSKNEIPLLDNDTHKVLYGIDALVAIIGQRCPVVRIAGRWSLVNWLLKKLYNFISYNRKVVVARSTTPGAIDCTPNFRVGYRVAFMLVFLIFNTAMLFPLYSYLLERMPFSSISLAEFHAMHGVVVLINCMLALTLSRREAIEYLGQVNMLALITILLLAPLVVLNKFFEPVLWFNCLYLLLLTALVLEEYLRRMHYAGVLLRHKKIVVTNFICIVALIASLFVL